MTTATQKELFLADEADRWFERNAKHLEGAEDILIGSLEQLNVKPKKVLEIGCANGYRLARLSSKYGAAGAGIEPSPKAVEDGRNRFRELDLHIGTADKLPFPDDSFDLVIFGFCLYLVDPRDHFRTIAEADRVLADGGLMVIYDFIEPKAYYNDYSHKAGIRSHKMEFGRYFAASPLYSHLLRRLYLSGNDYTIALDRRCGVDIYLKDLKSAFAPNPLRGVEAKSGSKA